MITLSLGRLFTAHRFMFFSNIFIVTLVNTNYIKHTQVYYNSLIFLYVVKTARNREIILYSQYSFIVRSLDSWKYLDLFYHLSYTGCAINVPTNISLVYAHLPAILMKC